MKNELAIDTLPPTAQLFYRVLTSALNRLREDEFIDAATHALLLAKVQEAARSAAPALLQRVLPAINRIVEAGWAANNSGVVLAS